MRQLATIFFLCLIIQLVAAQERMVVPSVKNTTHSKSEIKRQQEADDLFHRIEQGMINGLVENFSDAFALSLSLSVGIKQKQFYLNIFLHGESRIFLFRASSIRPSILMQPDESCISKKGNKNLHRYMYCLRCRTRIGK
jgi:hypothetical protein